VDGVLNPFPHTPDGFVEYDVVTDEARAWAAARSALTLIVEVASASGLTREPVERLKAWAADVALSLGVP